MSVAAVSVVICTTGRPAELERCLRALAVLDPAAAEVVIVDNSAGDPATEAVALRSGARYVVEPRPGLSRARNTGALAAREALIAYTDDDAVPDPNWLGAHLPSFDDPAVAVSSGRVLPLGTNGSSETVWIDHDLGTVSYQLDRGAPDWFERTNFGGAGIGGNIVVRHAVFDAGWRFHERLGVGTPIAGGEEHHAFFDLVRRGHAVVYVPDAIVRHDARESRQRRQRIAAASVAYMLLLFVENPAHRRDVLRYIATAGRRSGRPWRPSGARRGITDSRRDLVAALALGPILYLRSLTGCWRSGRSSFARSDVEAGAL
jgi:glycosyltransferase involved in cell wall biosynthesis